MAYGFGQIDFVVNAKGRRARPNQRIPIARAFGINNNGHLFAQRRDNRAKPLAGRLLELIVRQQSPQTVKNLNRIDPRRNLQLEKFNDRAA